MLFNLPKLKGETRIADFRREENNLLLIETFITSFRTPKVESSPQVSQRLMSDEDFLPKATKEK